MSFYTIRNLNDIFILCLVRVYDTFVILLAAWRGATGLFATSPRSFLAVGFPLLSLAEILATSKTVVHSLVMSW